MRTPDAWHPPPRVPRLARPPPRMANNTPLLLPLRAVLATLLVSAAAGTPRDWNDSINLGDADGIPADPLANPLQLLLLHPRGCARGNCEKMDAFWARADDSFPGMLWRADCRGRIEEIAKRHVDAVCGRALQRRWVDTTGSQVLQWREGAWWPWNGAKDFSALGADLRMSYESHVEDLVQRHGQDVDALAAALFDGGGDDDSSAPARQGSVAMLTPQLPVWYNCSHYELRKSLSLDQQLREDFFPTNTAQRQYFEGYAWKLRWEVENGGGDDYDGDRDGSSVAFRWWKDGERPEDAARTVRLMVAPMVVGTSEQGEDDDDNERQAHTLQRRCSLPWGKTKSDDALNVSVDGVKAYDWMRFRFLEFADKVVQRVQKKRKKKKKDTKAPVVYDPVGGSCWFPMLVKAKLPEARVICSDIDPAAVALARENFAANDLEGRFLVGDLFEPLRELVAQEPDTKPDVVYYLPPQEVRPSYVTSAGMSVPDVAVFVPEEADADPHYFFRRLVKELPELLAEDASVFVSVAHADVENVTRVITEAGWPRPKVRLSRMTLPDWVETGVKRPFLNPSGLLEFELGKKKRRRGRTKKKKKKKGKGRKTEL